MELVHAQAVAHHLTTLLAPHCARLHVAGSVRRENRTVKDIELVCLPAKVQVSAPTLFEDTPAKWAVNAPWTHAVNALGTPVKGTPSARYMQIEYRSFYGPIKLDLFMPEEPDYWRQLAIRTGSADFVSRHLAYAWRARGWCGVPELGLRRQEDCQNLAPLGEKPRWKLLNPDGQKPPVWASEQEFFQWCGMEWLEPRLRNF